MPSPLLPALLPLLLLLARPLIVRPAPPTCYSRMLALSREITGLSEGLQAAEPQVRHPHTHIQAPLGPRTRISKAAGPWCSVLILAERTPDRHLF